MAASKWQVYNEAKKFLLTGLIDLDTSAIRMKMVKNASAAKVSDYTRSTFDSCGTAVAFSGAGNNTRTPANIKVTAGASAKEIMFDSDDVVFTASGTLTSIRYAVIGVSGGKSLAWCKLSADTDLSAASTLTIQINASGYFTLTGGITA